MAANVVDYGAVSGSLCDTAIAAAISASGGAIYFPKGTYLIAHPIALPQGFSVTGDGPGSSIILNTTPNQPTLPISNIQHGTIRDIQLDRNVTAAAGGNGIDCTAIEGLTVTRVLSQHNWQNYALGSTDWSVLRDVESDMAVSHGFAFVSNGGPLQWQIFNALSSGSGGDGYYVEARGAGAPLGEWDTLQTFANRGNGLRMIAAPDKPIGAIRLKNLALDSDLGWSLYAETGLDFKLTTASIGSTGAGGIFIGESVKTADFSSVTVGPNPYHGALISSAYWSWHGGSANNNKGSGLAFLKGYGQVFGGLFFGNQNYGLYFDSSVHALVSGPICQANGFGPFNPAPTVTVRDPLTTPPTPLFEF
jgi:hypothetical protein